MTLSLTHGTAAFPPEQQPPPPPSTAVPTPSETSTIRDALLQNLRGQQFQINDLRPAFGSWRFDINPALDRLRTDIDEWISCTFCQHPKVKKLRRGDYGLFGATWWPVAAFERVSIATRLAVWLFVWDDEIDLDDGSYASDFDGAQTFRRDTLKFVRSSIGIDDDEAVSDNPIIASFDCIGQALRQVYSTAQRQNFYDELLFFMEKSEVEQRWRQGDNLPELDEFWRFRLGTSAVRVVLAMSEFCNNSPLPPPIFHDETFRDLVKICNVNICSLNDLLSIRKELEQGSLESLIPILFVHFGSVQVAADEIVGAYIRDTVEALDECAEEMFRRWAGRLDATEHSSLSLYIDGCRNFCTGNLAWSLLTNRYGVLPQTGDRTIVVQL